MVSQCLAHVDETAWESFFELREQVNSALDQAKKDKLVGSSIAATVTVANLDHSFANSIGESYEQLFIVAKVEDGNTLSVRSADGVKCPRCWNFGEPADPEGETHNELCPRCFEAVTS